MQAWLQTSKSWNKKSEIHHSLRQIFDTFMTIVITLRLLLSPDAKNQHKFA